MTYRDDESIREDKISSRGRDGRTQCFTADDTPNRYSQRRQQERRAAERPARRTDGRTTGSNGIPTERKPKGHRKRSKRTAFVSAGKHQKTGAIIQSDSDKR